MKFVGDSRIGPGLCQRICNGGNGQEPTANAAEGEEGREAEAAQMLWQVAAMDAINGRMGRNTVYLAGAGRPERREWKTRFDSLSPRYTTSWDDLPVAR